MTEADQALGRIYHTEAANNQNSSQQEDDEMEVSVQSLDEKETSPAVAPMRPSSSQSSQASGWLVLITLLIIILPTLAVWFLVFQRGLI